MKIFDLKKFDGLWNKLDFKYLNKKNYKKFNKNKQWNRCMYNVV